MPHILLGLSCYLNFKLRYNPRPTIKKNNHGKNEEKSPMLLK